ncbi:MAG: serine hydrolase [Planctomycetes bacterium]|nr:serine hydrolase [Planctomycetota bacterium]
MPTSRFLFALCLLLSLFAQVHAKDEPKAEPRKTSKADQRKIDAERKTRLKEREQRAKANAKSHEELTKKLDALMESYKERGFSGSVLVAKDGKVLLKKGYAMADREAKRANAPDTLFDIGSVTKTFTAAGILRLEQDGKLRLEDTLGKFFPNAPADKKPITLTQLLSHSGGISRMYDSEHFDYENRDNTVKGLLSIPLTSKPGEKFEYSNTNYFIAAAVIEIASGESYETYMQKHIIEASGMKDSGFCSSEKLDDKRGAMRYEDGQNKGSVTDWPFTWGQKGCGYMVSTVEDMWRFSEAIEWTDFLDARAKELWFTVQKDSYALGWSVLEVEGKKMQCHAGAAPGARSYLARLPEEDAMFVLLINACEQGSLQEFDIAREISALLRSPE